MRHPLLVCVALLVGGGVALVGACVGTTGTQRLSFTASASGIERDAAQPYRFTNDAGWTITLQRASLTFGPLYLDAAEPPYTTSGRDWFLKIGLVRMAHADTEAPGGHVVGEVLDQLRLDLLRSDSVSFAAPGSALSSVVRSTQVWFYPPPGTPPNAVDPRGSTLEVAGVAERADVVVPFSGSLVLDESWLRKVPGGGAPSIEEIRKTIGIPSTFLPTQGGTLRIRIDARSLFQGARFEELEGNPPDPSVAGGKLLVQSEGGATASDQVMQTLFNRLRSTRGTFDVRWER